MNSFWDARRLNGCPNSYVLNWSDEFYVCHRNHPGVTGEKAVSATFLYKAHTPCLVPGMALTTYWSCLRSFLFSTFLLYHSSWKQLPLFCDCWEHTQASNALNVSLKLISQMRCLNASIHERHQKSVPPLENRQDRSLTHSKVCISPHHPQSLLRHTISH